MSEAMIFKAISKTMQDIGIVGKNDKNEYDKYKYRGIDAVMNALNPAMIANGIFAVPEVVEHKQQERTSKKGELLIYTVVKVVYTLYAADGSHVEAVVVGEAMDRSDKSTNKAMSAAFKYAMFQLFCIPTEEMKDADAESPQAEPIEDKPIDELHFRALQKQFNAAGIKMSDVLAMYGISKPSEVTYGLERSMINKFGQIVEALNEQGE